METKTNEVGAQVAITRQEAEEFCVYKRQKKIAEIMAAMRRLESVFSEGEDVEAFCERSARLRLSAVRMSPVELLRYGEICKRHGVRVDCVIGEGGETFAKVKAYEGKLALRKGASELCVRIPRSLLLRNGYAELKKELKKLRRRFGKAVWKARIEHAYPQATLSRLARVVSECGANYLSLPYFAGCERLQTELFGGCQLEVSGVNTLEELKQTAGAGMGRVLTSRAGELYSELLVEAEKISVGSELPPPKVEEPKAITALAKPLPKPLPLPTATAAGTVKEAQTAAREIVAKSS